jgi:redox-sensitive bicupin YhaK (pirin superfamily)
MTAASGIVHEEYHSTKFSKEGGALEMVQLWVNLPSKDKMVPPRYQPILESDIPSVEMEDGKGSVRIIAGSYNGVKGPALTFSPMNIWQVLIKAHCHFQFEVEEGFNCMTFSRFGRFSHVDNNEKKTKVESEEMAIFNRDNGSWVKLEAGDEDVSLIVLSGQPLNEPIAARGPFVMNTETELRQAMYDYQTGKF